MVINEDNSQKSLVTWISKFRNDVNPQNEKTEKLTKYYKIPNGVIYNVITKESIKINGITFSGQLTKIDNNKTLGFAIVDKVWLIMKSIFDERTFRFTENGTIIENKK